jgi:hypothetical protein
VHAESTTPQTVLFPDLFGKALVACFDEPHASSDGGAILLKAADRRLGLIERLSACVTDARQAGKVHHTIGEMIAQRVFALASGYPDCNDAARIGDDPIHKLLVGRDPIDGEALASQPTLSRFENAVGPRTLYRMAETLADVVIERHRRRLRGKARRITIDLDPTDDPTHGGQQYTLFNGYYGTWCYLPVVGFLTFDEEPEQHLFAAMLRPGNAPAKLGAVAILRRVLERLRRAFPKARYLVRLDGGFACPEVLDFLDAARGLDYVVAIAENQVLARSAEPLMRKVRRLAKISDETVRRFGECRYRAGTWKTARRVVIKAEIVRLGERAPKDNPRFVVTSLRGKPQTAYQKYRERGDIENRIKELHHGLEIDRTSCTRFFANQLRVLLTAAAYVLLQEIRRAAARTASARAQVSTLRDRFLKIGARVIVSVRRIVLHMPEAFPYTDQWRRVAGALGAG